MTARETRADTAPVVVGPLRWNPRGRAGRWLSAARARYALERLWTVVSGGSAWPGGPSITFEACDVADIRSACAVPEAIARLGPSLLLPPPAKPPWEGCALPAVFGSAGDSSPVFSHAGDTLSCRLDLPAFVFFMLARWEEVDSAAARESLDRFPAVRSLAAGLDVLDWPVVDLWASVLRAWLRCLAPQWQPRPHLFRLKLSCDVDAVQRFPDRRAVVRATAGVLRRRHDVVAAWREVQSGRASLRDWRVDPYALGVGRIMAAAERHGQRAAFYFRAADPGLHDGGYALDQPPASALVREVIRRGHEVGLHPGWDTHDDPTAIASEKARLDAVRGSNEPCGGRQHYLRFTVPDTWRHWDAVGMSYDSTLGYPERTGFRCGTCHPYPVWDSETDRELALLEYPLIVMDTTLRSAKYEGLPADAALDRIVTLARRCRVAGGVFTLLWHNSSFSGAYEGWCEIFEPAMQALAALPAADAT